MKKSFLDPDSVAFKRLCSMSPSERACNEDLFLKELSELGNLLPLVREVVRRILLRHHVGEACVDDVVETAIIKCWLSPPSVSEKLRAWILTVARREALATVGRELPYAVGLQDWEGEPAEGYLPMPAAELTPADVMEHQEGLDTLNRVWDAFVGAAKRKMDGDSISKSLYEFLVVRRMTSAQAGMKLGLTDACVRQRWGRFLRHVIEDVRQQLLQHKASSELFGDILKSSEFHGCLTRLLAEMRLVQDDALAEAVEP